MTQENITTEGNRIIAEFMGIPKCNKHRKIECGHFKFGAGVYFLPYEMKYHTSWDWLMPVVEKICKMRFPSGKPEDEDYDDTSYLRTFGQLTEDGKFMVRFNRFGLFESEELIEAAYPAVIDYIEWYNNQNKLKP